MGALSHGRIEVMILPVTDIYRAKSFYVGRRPDRATRDLPCRRRRRLGARGARRQGVEISPLRHKHPRDAWVGGWAEGVDPDRTPYASFADFTDPDRHRWVMQEIGPE